MLGVLTDEEFDKELIKIPSSQPKELVPSIDEVSIDAIVESLPKPGRGNTPEVPDMVRSLAATEAISGNTLEDVAKAFGLSTSSVSAYKNSATSTASYNTPQKKLASSIDLFRNRITKKASRVLIGTLDSLNEADVLAAKPRERAGIARDMASIISNINPTPKDTSSDRPNVQFIMYAPPVREESKYEVIDAIDGDVD